MPPSPDARATSEEVLFAEALALPLAERQDFVERECQTRGLLPAPVLALLQSYEKNSGFLDVPAPAAVLQRALAPSAGPFEPAPGDSIGHYRLLERIGEGGFGIVYVAEQREPVRRRVALKLIRLGMDTREFIARFEAERQALALMDHPNIARVFDAGATEAGRPYLVMELVRGAPITTFCDEQRLPLRARLELFIAVCGAIQHAHQKGVIHRDLKPSNILVAREEDAPVPKVIDFGIAKAVSGPLTDKTLFTRHHALIGTPAYTSPEQTDLGARDVDTRSDVYSLGAMLYELLTGTPPFERAALEQANFDELRRLIRETEPPRASQRVRTLAEHERRVVSARRGVEPAKLGALLVSDLDWIVLRCLDKDRARRYESASALALDLRRHLDHEPVTARPPSRGYRLRKFVRKHRTPAFAAAAVAMSLISGLVTTGVSLLRERAAAEKSRQVARFMQEMLGRAGPSIARGRDTTLLREVLDDTIRRLDTELRDQPDVVADLRHTLGLALQDIGDYDRAAAQWRASIAARRASGDSHSVELAATLHALGAMLWRINQPSEAEITLQEALKIRRRTLGPDHFDVGTTLTAIAYNPGSPRFARERIALLEQAAAIQRQYPGRDDDEFAETLLTLGFVLSTATYYEQAHPIMRESIAIRRRVHQGPHPRLAEALGILARSTFPAGELKSGVREGRDLHREVLQMVQQVRGQANANLVRALLDFASEGLSAETREADVLLARAVVEDLRRVLPEDSPDLAVAQLVLASLLEGDGRDAAEAESLARNAMERIGMARERGVSPHPETSSAMAFFAMRAHADGRLGYARLMAEALQADRKFGSVLAYGPPVARILGLVYHDLGFHAEATRLLETSLQRERNPWRPLWRSVQRASLFINYAYAGDSYRHQGRLVESRRVLEEGIARQLEGAEQYPLAELARAAVRAELGYTAMAEGKFGEAESLFRAALIECDSGPSVNQWALHRPRARMVSGLGQALAGQGKFAEAEPLVLAGFSELIEQREKWWGDPTLMLREACDGVAGLYRACGKLERAAAWERKLAELR